MIRHKFALIFVLFLIVRPASTFSQTRSNDVVTFGVLVCLTGVCSEYGDNSLKGAELAVDDLNKIGGIFGKKVRLIVEDSNEENPASAVSAFYKLASSPNVRFILGPSWTPAGLAIAPIAAKRKELTLISSSIGVKEFNESGSNIFNVWPHDELGTRELARHILKKGLKRIAIFSNTQSWCKSQGDFFEDDVKKNGGIITEKVEPLDSITDLKMEAIRIVKSNPQAVFFSNIKLQMGIAAKEISRIKPDIPKFAILMDRTTIDAAQGAFEGAIFAAYPEANKLFVDKFVQKYGIAPGISADTSYDAVMVYAKALEQAGSEKASGIPKILVDMPPFKGASGSIKFNESGAVISKNPVFKKVTGTLFENVSETSVPSP